MEATNQTAQQGRQEVQTATEAEQMCSNAKGGENMKVRSVALDNFNDSKL